MKLSDLLTMLLRPFNEISHCEAFGHAMWFNRAAGRWECSMCPAWCWPRDAGPKAIRQKLPVG